MATKQPKDETPKDGESGDEPVVTDKRKVNPEGENGRPHRDRGSDDEVVDGRGTRSRSS
jgi:hypothetical protein